MTSRKVPADLLQALVEHFNPRKVILFGSRARAGARRDSDHDLLVIVDDDIPPEKHRKAVDIVPYRQSTYDDQLGVVGTLPHMAEADGVVVFDRARRLAGPRASRPAS
jgi:predicted nucleotidyltransferase